MNKHLLPPERQAAQLKLRAGRRFRLRGSVTVTDRGLLAIAILVSSILLSTAALVRAAVRNTP